jgi:hypothetical protein
VGVWEVLVVSTDYVKHGITTDPLPLLYHYSTTYLPLVNHCALTRSKSLAQPEVPLPVTGI